LDSVRTDLDSVKTTMKTELDSVRKDYHRLELRMENEVISKIQALFDGYITHDARLTRVEDTLGEVAENVRFLVLRVAKLEVTAQ